MSANESDTLQGVILPILTPLTDDGALDQAALRRLIRRALGAGIETIFVGGSAGMGPMLTEKQWTAAVATAAEETAGAARLLAGIIAPSTQQALRQIELSRQAGCPAIVVTPTFYITLRRDDEMLAHFAACRDATDQEMVIYNIPSCTQSVIPPAVVAETARRGWSRAMKESSGDRAYFSQILAVARETGMALLQGNEPDIAWGLEQGAAGIVPVCANCFPEPYVSAVRAARAGDRDRLRRLQRVFDHIRDVILVGDHNWISGLFCALEAQEIGNGRPLLPLQPVTGPRRDMIRELMRAGAPEETALV